MLILKTLIQVTFAVTIVILYRTYNDIKYERYKKEMEKQDKESL